ncbi:MAG: serine/threonine-protein kinase [Polyangiaceae bacterium]
MARVVPGNNPADGGIAGASPVAHLGGSGGTTVTATEEGRAFFQARLAVFGLCLFVLAGGSWALLTLASLFGSGGASDAYRPFSFSGTLHLCNGLLAGLLWIGTRSGRRPGRVLHAFDIATSLGLIAIWSLAQWALPRSSGPYIALLSFATGFLARAIVVPSTAERTLLIGALGSVMLIVSTLWHGTERGVLAGAVATGSWATSAVVIGTFASHTIFGLRRQVQQARVLGQYTLETKLGEGGMGSVWRASHALLRRPTAVKLLPAARMGEAAIQRFEREVQLTARLTHPNTVAIYDYGRTRDGVFYYAMELLEGTDIERLVQEHGAQPPERVVHVLTQICGALAEAHDLGLVHRDVKPANVLLSPRRHEHELAKIVDFGLVKRVDTSPEHANLTGSNTITGTPLYMSPEAIQTPDAVDARSDLYALGALAWFMLVGKPPFEGSSIVEICGQHLLSPARRPGAALGQPIASDLEDLVLACLEKRAGDRPPDARTLRRMLEGSSVAGLWTPERAAAWWQSHAPVPVAEKTPSTGPRTIALDVSQRERA